MKVDDILRYGTILEDDELFDTNDALVRIRMVNYDNNIYYIKMVNGEIKIIKKLGE